MIQIVLVAGGWLAFGRSVAAAQAPQLDQPPTPPAIEEPTPAQVYSYQSAGRRDPFVSLVGQGPASVSARERPLGLQGLDINEMTLRGIVLSRGEYLAVLEAPDTRTYIVRVSDILFDGIVRAITADTVIFLQAVTDPSSLETEREVRRTLRSGEENRRGEQMTRRGWRASMALASLTSVVLMSGMTVATTAPIQLVAISSRMSPGTLSILIEASQPAPYITSQPDPLTLFVDLRNVSTAGVVNRVSAGQGPVRSVDIEALAAPDGTAVARVRMSLATPVRHEVHSTLEPFGLISI